MSPSRARCALLFTAAVACTRSAEVGDEPDAFYVTPTIAPDAEVPEVDAALRTDSHPSCDERPNGDCIGANDFPCDFRRWVLETIPRCFLQTDCRSNGWVSVRMGADGCVDAIGMTEPDPEFIACLAAEFDPWQCPCEEGYEQYYLGERNEGCPEGPKG